MFKLIILVNIHKHFEKRTIIYDQQLCALIRVPVAHQQFAAALLQLPLPSLPSPSPYSLLPCLLLSSQLPAYSSLPHPPAELRSGQYSVGLYASQRNYHLHITSLLLRIYIRNLCSNIPLHKNIQHQIINLRFKICNEFLHNFLVHT